ncbi:MAG TPA: glutathione S-transferase family protein [Burkholderiales bacterium]|nr:glutathione S-transferase family protein [Burkholderiales bacterium]
MLTLYFSPGACSTASHIGLEEAGAEYQERPTLLGKGENRTESYLKVNPRGKVPALDADGRVITENTAILTYIARRFPEKKLLPEDPVAQAQCISFMAWLSNSVHPNFTQFFKPEKFVSNESSKDDAKQTGKQNFFTALKEVDSLLAGKQWVMGDQFTVADCYAIVFYGWGVRAELPVKELANYTAWKDRMLARPAVRKVLESEGNILVKGA